MGASESRDLSVYNKMGNGKQILCIFEFTDQKKGLVEARSWIKDDQHGHSPMTVKVDEHQWPGWSWMPVTYGVGTGFPEVTITIICGTNYIRYSNEDLHPHIHGREFVNKIGLFTLFVYEDGLRVGLEPKGWIFKRGTEYRTLHPWKPVKSCVTVRPIASDKSRTDWVLDEENNVVVSD